MSPAERDDAIGAMGGLDRAAAILGAFDATHRELTLAALVTRCGMPRSTTHRTADRMIRLGWLDKPLDRYRIGNRLFEIASLSPTRLELREAVLPFLQDLHHATKIWTARRSWSSRRYPGTGRCRCSLRSAAPSPRTARPWGGPSWPTPTP
jgi:hypothetical protein